jgi:metal-responsive CopG/Arc/MetJ family transcriptional regulator
MISLVKTQISVTMDSQVVKELDNYQKLEFPEGNRSQVVERIVRLKLKQYKEEKQISLSIISTS